VYSKVLHILNSQLETLHPATLYNLISLEILHLHYNQITSLHANTFNGLTNLTEIRLDHNQLTVFPPNLFAGLISLQRLYLNGNKISSIDSQIFKSLIALKLLDLQLNPIVNLDSAAFVKLAAFNSLFINLLEIKKPMPLAFHRLAKKNLVVNFLFQNETRQVSGRLLGKAYLTKNRFASEEFASNSLFATGTDTCFDECEVDVSCQAAAFSVNPNQLPHNCFLFSSLMGERKRLNWLLYTRV
jgi:Leucine-rich repeat (LRR) protein